MTSNISYDFMNDIFTTRKDMYRHSVKFIKAIIERNKYVDYFIDITNDVEKTASDIHKNYTFCILTKTRNKDQSLKLLTELNNRFENRNTFKYHALISNSWKMYVFIALKIPLQKINNMKEYIIDYINYNDEKKRKYYETKRNERELKEYRKQKLLENNENIKIGEYPQDETNKNNTCNCCMCDYEDDELIFCDKNKNHITCRECIKQYINVMISDGSCSLSCMFHNSDNCGGLYYMEDIEYVYENEICKKSINKFFEIYEINNVKNLSLLLNDFQVCPHCLKYGLQVDNDIGIINLECGLCKKIWCNQCRREHNGGKNCYFIDDIYDESGNIDLKEVIVVIDNTINNIISKILIDTCSHCKTSYIKTEGCNLITCSNCGKYTCDCCGMKIKPILVEGGTIISKYHHFKGNEYNNGSSNCPLYYDNVQIRNKQTNHKFKMNKIDYELQKLLDNNIIYKDVITKRIVKIKNEMGNLL